MEDGGVLCVTRHEYQRMIHVVILIVDENIFWVVAGNLIQADDGRN